MDSQVSSKVNASRKKAYILRRTILYFMADNGLMDVAQLVLTLLGWPNSENRALTCVQI